MRRGSVTEQHVLKILPDGEVKKRGPYPLLTWKRQGKTVSRRLKDAEETTEVRKQVARYRRFEQLIAELTQLGETWCSLNDDDQKKKLQKSPSNSTLK